MPNSYITTPDRDYDYSSGHIAFLCTGHLYVGASRATTHLAATFTQEEGNEDVIRYFDKTKDNWKL